MWTNEGTVEENWAAIRSALSEVAQPVHGTDCRRHPGWFNENAAQLKPLFEQRNQFFSR